jgi:hypothetical protein
MTLLEIIGAFALFFIIVLALGVAFGGIKCSWEITKDK